MSSLREGLRAYLAEQEPVVSLVGRKIFGEKGDQWARSPVLIYTQTSGSEPGHLTGATTLAQATVQIDAWSKRDKEAERIIEAVRDVLHTFLGGTMGDVAVRSCRLQSGPVSGWESQEDGGDVGAYRSSVNYGFWYRVLAPAL